MRACTSRVEVMRRPSGSFEESTDRKSHNLTRKPSQQINLDFATNNSGTSSDAEGLTKRRKHHASGGVLNPRLRDSQELRGSW